MIIEWKSGIYAQNQNYYGAGVSLNWLSSEFIARLLKVVAITSQYRDLNVITSQYRLIQPITTQYRQLNIITTENRLVKVITSQYKKVKALTSGG